MPYFHFFNYISIIQFLAMIYFDTDKERKHMDETSVSCIGPNGEHLKTSRNLLCTIPSM
jgi:hypothetical protein